MWNVSGLKIVGIVLVVLGIAGLAYGGLSWTRRDTVVDAGPIHITADKTERSLFAMGAAEPRARGQLGHLRFGLGRLRRSEQEL